MAPYYHISMHLLIGYTFAHTLTVTCAQNNRQFYYLSNGLYGRTAKKITNPDPPHPNQPTQQRMWRGKTFHVMVSFDTMIKMQQKGRLCEQHIPKWYSGAMWGHVQYIPRNMHTVFALLCFVVVIHWLIFPYPSGLLHWHCVNLTIAPVPAKPPRWIWIDTSCELIMNDCITTTKQSTTKPCAYFLGYTVGPNHQQLHCVFNGLLGPTSGYLLSPLLAFVMGIHRLLVDSYHKESVRREAFPC